MYQLAAAKIVVTSEASAETTKAFHTKCFLTTITAELTEELTARYNTIQNALYGRASLSHHT